MIQHLDLEHLALFVGLGLSQQTLDALRVTHPQVRFEHGFVFQHLITGAPTITELAEALEVTQQAASKKVQELVGFGWIERVPDPDDGRVSRLALTPAGRALIDAGRALRVERTARLQERLGTERYRQVTEALAALLEELDEDQRVRARKVRLPR